MIDCLEEGEEHDKEAQENLWPHTQHQTKVKTEMCLRLKLYHNKGIEVRLFQMLDSINIVEPCLSLKQASKSDHMNSQ